MRIPLVCLTILVSACVDIDPAHPLITGQRDLVSPRDIDAAIATIRKMYVEQLPSHPSWIDTYHVKGPLAPPYRVHVISRNKLQVYFGVHYGQSAPPDRERWDVERVNGKWDCLGWTNF